MRETTGAHTAVTASVVICTHSEDRWTELTDAIASVRAQSTAPLEVLVVVDHADVLLDRVRASLADAPLVRAVPNAGSPGLSGARNTGVESAAGDVVAFLDDDAFAEPGWLAALLAGYAGRHVVGVGGAILPVWAARAPRWFPPEFLWAVGCTYRGMPTARTGVRNLIGANMSFRRDVLQEVGGFTSSLGRAAGRVLHCEETELCIRVRRRDSRAVILFDPAAVVRHHVPRARWAAAYLRQRCFTEGLAKAEVAILVGSDAGLSTERAYILRTLPRGVARGIADGGRGDAAGPARAAALMAGLVLTTAGYAVGRTARWRSGRRADQRAPGRS